MRPARWSPLSPARKPLDRNPWTAPVGGASRLNDRAACFPPDCGEDMTPSGPGPLRGRAGAP